MIKKRKSIDQNLDHHLTKTKKIKRIDHEVEVVRPNKAAKIKTQDQVHVLQLEIPVMNQFQH